MNGKAITNWAEVEANILQLHGRISKERDTFLGHIGNLQRQIDLLNGKVELPLVAKSKPVSEAKEELRRLVKTSKMSSKDFYAVTGHTLENIYAAAGGELGGTMKPKKFLMRHAFAVDKAFNLAGGESFSRFVDAR